MSVDKAIIYLDDMTPGANDLHRRLGAFRTSNYVGQVTAFSLPNRESSRLYLSANILKTKENFGLIFAVFANLVLIRSALKELV